MNEQNSAAHDATERVRSQARELETLVESLDERLQKLVAEKPLLVLGGTLLAGFFAGRILSRK